MIDHHAFARFVRKPCGCCGFPVAEGGSVRVVRVTVSAPAEESPPGVRAIAFEVTAKQDLATRGVEKSTFLLPWGNCP